jgi:hypothetical protein
VITLIAPVVVSLPVAAAVVPLPLPVVVAVPLSPLSSLLQPTRAKPNVATAIKPTALLITFLNIFIPPKFVFVFYEPDNTFKL